MSTVQNTVSTGQASAAANKAAAKGEISEAQAAKISAMESNAVSLFTPNADKNQTGFDFFFSAGSSLASVKTINSARLGIENRARTLLAEIRMDSIRGVDTSSKREQLSALTGNLDIMNKNLSNNIDKVMKPSKPKEDVVPIIDRINADLKKIQEKEEARVQEKYGKREDPKEAESEKAEESE